MSKIIASDVRATHVATLVCSPEISCLKVPLLEAVRDTLPSPADAAWLNEGIAADLFFEAGSGVDLKAVSERAIASLSGAPVDIIVQPLLMRRKRLFLADMDSTMIGQECIDELAAFVGLKPQVSEITERAMRGELAFEPALRERVALLKGLDIGVVDAIIRDHLTLTDGGTTLVRTMKAHGVYTCLVSGGFTLFTTRIGAMIGFDEDRSNTLEHHNGLLSGTVSEPILGKEAKLATLRELSRKLELEPAETIAVGDGANDLAMLQAAGLGVAFRAKPAVAAAAHARVEHSNLTALLYAQGYHVSEFVD